MRLLISRSQVRISEVTEFLVIRGFFLIFIIELNRAAFCRFLASDCKATLRLLVKLWIFGPSFSHIPSGRKYFVRNFFFFGKTA